MDPLGAPEPQADSAAVNKNNANVFDSVLLVLSNVLLFPLN